MAIYGDTLGDLSRNQLAFRLANDARANAIANQLAVAADRASRERMVNRDVDAQNFRWLNPNATAQAELASRERIHDSPSGNVLAENQNRMDIAKVPYFLGMTPADEARLGEMAAERKFREKMAADELAERKRQHDTLSAYHTMMKDNPNFFLGGSAAGNIQRDNATTAVNLAQAQAEAARRFGSKLASDKTLAEVVGMLDDGVGPWWKFSGDTFLSDREGTARKIIAGEAIDKNKYPTGYDVSQLWAAKKKQIADDVLNEMAAEGSYVGGLAYDPAIGRYAVDETTRSLVDPNNRFFNGGARQSPSLLGPRQKIGDFWLQQVGQ